MGGAVYGHVVHPESEPNCLAPLNRIVPGAAPLRSVPAPGWLRRSLSCPSDAGGCERAPLRPRQWDGCGRLESALESCFGGRPYPSSHPAFHGPRGISRSPEGRAALAWTERESSAVWTSLPARGPPGEGVAGRGSRRPLQEGPQAAVPTGRFPLSPRTPRFFAVASLMGAVTVVKFGAGGRDEILF